MPVSKEQVLHIARLSRLDLSETEIREFTHELTAIIDYFEQLKQVRTDSIEFKNRSAGRATVLRDDTIQPSLPREQALVNSPGRDEEYFRVPRVFME